MNYIIAFLKMSTIKIILCRLGGMAMNGESIFLFIIGVYLLISAYLILVNEKLFTILFGYTLREAKLIEDSKKLVSKLGTISIGFGIFFTSVSIIINFYNNVIFDQITYLAFIVLILNMFFIVRDIKKGYYN